MIFDFVLEEDDMLEIMKLDKSSGMFFDHKNPEMVKLGKTTKGRLRTKEMVIDIVQNIVGYHMTFFLTSVRNAYCPMDDIELM